MKLGREALVGRRSDDGRNMRGPMNPSISTASGSLASRIFWIAEGVST